ncbi:MAG: short-chain dehydrogenase/reductase [Verrucomicrobia bacterium]|nr:short-chain dehydrogenase/reductase [Verrucomicrobiota bacterium]
MAPWHSLEGKRVWVTGGAGYLGSAIVRELDRAGARTLCIDLPGKAEALVNQHGLKNTVPVSCDLTQVAQLPGFVTQSAAAHGVPDGVVHLAFASSAGRTLEQLTAAEFQHTFAAALTPAFVLGRAVAECMKPRGSGSVVFFASMYGVVAPDPAIYAPPLTPNPIDYGASKAAVLQLARYFAVHYGSSGIRFNCVTPGPFPNPGVQQANPKFIGELERKTALRRVGQNHEIVGPALFLLTDSASFVTGHSLAVDGGWTAW